MKLLVEAPLVAIAASFLCQCQSYHHESSISNALVFEECMINDLKKDKPWESNKPGNGNIIQGQIIASKTDSFHDGVDDPHELLVCARKGNGSDQATGKLQDYVTQHPHPDLSICLEFERMWALRHGIDGVARYYTKNKGSWKASKDRRSIEEAIHTMESKAVAGNWIYAVALYEFMGSLDQVGGSLPWGQNKELSARWLETIYKSADREAFNAVVINEALQTGHAQKQYLDGTYFPHMPEGWKPSN